jgi:DNA-binding NtrC family response regulator
MSESEPRQPGLKERLETLCKEMVDKGILFPEAMDHFERCFIAEVMHKHQGNLIRSAASLQIHRNTLAKKVKHLKKIKSRPI